MFLYMQTAPDGDDFNCRGAPGAGDDPASFARLMGRRGLAVMTCATFVGKSTTRAVLDAMGGQVLDPAPLPAPPVGTFVPPPASPPAKRAARKKGA